jgi:hypothetical protein
MWREEHRWNVSVLEGTHLPNLVFFMNVATVYHSEPCCLGRVQFWIARTLRLWFRIPLEAWMFVHVFLCCPVQEALRWAEPSSK